MAATDAQKAKAVADYLAAEAALLATIGEGEFFVPSAGSDYAVTSYKGDVRKVKLRYLAGRS